MTLLQHPWLIWGASLVAVVAMVTVAHLIVFAIAARATGRTDSVIDEALVRRGRRPTLWVVWLLVVLALLPKMPTDAATLDAVRRVVSVLLTGAIGWLAIALTGVIEDYVEARFDITQADNLTARQMHTRIRVLRRVAVAVIAVITVCLMLMSFPAVRQIGVSLFASAGIAGLVIGMAARPALSNLIAGLQIALTDPVRIDDVVIVEGEWGWIEEITSTYVVVRIWDLRRLIVPLSYFIENPFQNWTRRSADILGTVFLYADYRVPVAEVRQAFFDIVATSDLWDGKVKVFQVTNAGAESVELRALMSAGSAGQAWDLRCFVREELLAWLQANHPDSLPRMRVELERDVESDRHPGRPQGKPGSTADGSNVVDR
ncbi:MAG: mechanosensitive ion channel family protein [Alphaproteobacteria bacterium]